MNAVAASASGGPSRAASLPPVERQVRRTIAPVPNRPERADRAVWLRDRARVFGVLLGERARLGGHRRRLALPGEALDVPPLLQAERAVDPGVRAVGERGPVIGLAPDEQPALAMPGDRLLQPVAVHRIVMLVDAAVADDLGNEFVQRLEAEGELTAGGLGARRCRRHRAQENDRQDRREESTQLGLRCPATRFFA